jgi:pimeloyl-ACP methyl ester carboxylesterase
MKKRLFVVAAVGGGSAIAGGCLARHCRDDLNAARARLAAIDRSVLLTAFGAVEYAERGAGEPLLAIHGIFGGCDAGLLSLRGLFPDRRVIAPSRFGYLGSSMPPGATPADQADAFAALLDGLGIGQADVIAISSGASSGLQFALRHPDRVQHLAVLSGDLPGSPTAAAPPQGARLLFRSDLAVWALKVFARPALTRLAGVPQGFALTADDARFVTEILDSIFPVAARAEGAIFDGFVSDPDVNNYDLAAVSVPTLIVHARDEPLGSYDAAQRAAGRIPGARLVSLDRGGHLMLGQQEAVRAELAAFWAA